MKATRHRRSVQQCWRPGAGAHVQQLSSSGLGYCVGLQICRPSVLVIATLHIRQLRRHLGPLGLVQVPAISACAGRCAPRARQAAAEKVVSATFSGLLHAHAAASDQAARLPLETRAPRARIAPQNGGVNRGAPRPRKSPALGRAMFVSSSGLRQPRAASQSARCGWWPLPHAGRTSAHLKKTHARTESRCSGSAASAGGDAPLSHACSTGLRASARLRVDRRIDAMCHAPGGRPTGRAGSASSRRSRRLERKLASASRTIVVAGCGLG